MARTKTKHGSGLQPVLPKMPVTFPGGPRALSNIPISVPRYFLGRDEVLAKIKIALAGDNGRVAITALHGLRGVGKTTLAAAYADRHRANYRATWWIKAQTEATVRADLVALGVRLGLVAADDKEEPALATVMEHLSGESDRVLLIYDNAVSADQLRKYLPRGGAVQIIVTSNAPNWRGIAAPVEIEVWPREVGAEYLFARTGRDGERDVASALSAALGGLPLAHEQAAAYCERLGISFADYLKRFEATPVKLLDTEKDAPAEYHDRMTVAKTFALAIDEAANLHQAAALLIEYAALLAPEPIPLFLFAEGREKFGEPLATALAGDGLDDAVAALRNFALVDREMIADERDPSITTDAIRLHRLVRLVASERIGDLLDFRRAILLDILAGIYSEDILHESKTWPRARRLDAHTLALTDASSLPKIPEQQMKGIWGWFLRFVRQRIWISTQVVRAFGAPETASVRSKTEGRRYSKLPDPPARNRPFMSGNYVSIKRMILVLYTAELRAADLLIGLSHYRLRVLSDLTQAQFLLERALAIRERRLGPQNRNTGVVLHALADVLLRKDDLVGAKQLFERAVKIFDKVLGPNNTESATNLQGLAIVSLRMGDLPSARLLAEQSMAVRERMFGADDVRTGFALNHLALVLEEEGDLVGARSLRERALAIIERKLGPEHIDTATALFNLGVLLGDQRDFVGARPHIERALAIFEKTFGSAHPSTQNAASFLADISSRFGRRQLTKAARKKNSIKK
jgi:tetratricopeptide (TPR) repeat protein